MSTRTRRSSIALHELTKVGYTCQIVNTPGGPVLVPVRKDAACSFGLGMTREQAISCANAALDDIRLLQKILSVKSKAERLERKAGKIASQRKGKS